MNQLLFPNRPARLTALALASLCGTLASAQWDPTNRQYGKTDPDDLRVMTFNVRDQMSSTNSKQQAANGWTAIAVQVAALRPDILVLQETGDNSGLGTGTAQGYNTVDTVQRLTDTLNYFMRGVANGNSNDIYVTGNPPVTSYVTKFAQPGYDLPFVYVSTSTDNFNRNVLLSRFPLADLNGDARNAISDFNLAADSLAPWYSAGNGGIRGFMFAEINLPDDRYGGDLVMGNAHLKAGGASSDLAERLAASQRVAYYIDAVFNGLGGSTPDPRLRSTAFPRPSSVLSAQTPVIWAGDFNEDENTNGRDGPMLWMSRAQLAAPATDGTDRDRTDSTFDDSRDIFQPTNRSTQGTSSKLDYIAWQDSIAVLRRSFIFRASTIPNASLPTEFSGYPGLSFNISAASDHRPVIADFILPAPPLASGHTLTAPANLTENLAGPVDMTWAAASRVTSYELVLSLNSDLSSPILVQPVASSAPRNVSFPASGLTFCATYYWSVRAINRSGPALSPSGIFSFRARGQCDLNLDGVVDNTDFVAFADAYSVFESTVGDFNSDGFTDNADFVIFANAYAEFLACP